MMLASAFIGFAIGAITATILSYWKIRHYKLLSKFRAFYWCLVKFIVVKQHGYDLGKELLKRDISTVAIYGMKELGEILLYELKNGGVDVKYSIDREADSMYSEIEIYKPDDDLQSVDMIIVTVLIDNVDIINSLKERMKCKVITMNELLNYCDIK